LFRFVFFWFVGGWPLSLTAKSLRVAPSPFLSPWPWLPWVFVPKARDCLKFARGDQTWGISGRFGGWGCDLYRACISPGMQTNPSTCRGLTSDGTWSVSRWWCTFGRTAGRATLPEWISYSQGFSFEAKSEGEVRIYTNKQTNRQTF